MTLITDDEILNEIKYCLPGEHVDWIPGVSILVLENELVDTGRWSTIHSFVWQENGDKMYGILYENPATELQEVEDAELSEVYEVEPVQVVVTKYKKK
jgi:hypothetical protein